MSRMTGPHLKMIRERHPSAASIRTFVESGTFHGKTTRLAVEQFTTVHTIELHPDWYANAVRDLGPLGVGCWHGDSAVVIPRLAKEIAEPVFWYLDAHWFKLVPGVAGQLEGLPLWRELEALAARPYADVVVVDDVASFGRTEPTDEWLDVSLEKIAAYFPGQRENVILRDQAVVYR